MAFSNGWLGKSMNRHRLTSRRVQGEAASVDFSVMKKGRAARCVQHGRDCLFLLHAAEPDDLLAPGLRPQEPKEEADCGCATATLHRPKPRCFHGKSCVELGVDYASTAKAWMNTQLFNCWVARFNDAMRAEGRHVLRLLDNVSSHRVDEPLSNVSLQMLPPNITAFLQPQNAGIIRQFKAQILKRQNRHALDWLDNILERAAEIGEENIGQEIGKYCNVDVLVAMRWVQEAWEMVTTTTISNYWRHANILDEDMYSLIDCTERLRLV